MTLNWLTNMWEFISEINTHIIIPSLELEPQRNNKVPIMQIYSKHYSVIIYDCIHTICLYLQVVHLSNIVQPDSIHIYNSYFYLHQPHSHTFTISWPRQILRSEKSWEAWRTFLR